jgi:hypothetical protein
MSLFQTFKVLYCTYNSNRDLLEYGVDSTLNMEAVIGEKVCTRGGGATVISYFALVSHFVLKSHNV